MVVTGEGQIKKGDRLKIVGKNTLDDQYATAKKVITVSGKEEVIINELQNKYFITSLLIAGDSWARQVQVIN